MTNLEYLKKIKKVNKEYDSSTKNTLFQRLDMLGYKEVVEQRRVRALEIIAEELIKISESFNYFKSHRLL